MIDDCLTGQEELDTSIRCFPDYLGEGQALKLQSVDPRQGFQYAEVPADHSTNYRSHLASSVKYYVLGMILLLLRMASLGILLLILTVFELQRAFVSVLNHLAVLLSTPLSIGLFVFVLGHELVLTLRQNVYYLLCLDDELKELELQSNVKYSQLYSLFWTSNSSHRIRITDDFQSFEIVPNHDSDRERYLPSLDSKLITAPFTRPEQNQGINLSFISSPGISKVQQFNNKYKDKLKKRPHWWKVGPSKMATEEKIPTSQDIDCSITNQEADYSEYMKTSNFEGNGYALTSSPLVMNEAEKCDPQIDSSDLKSSPKISSSFHSKLKVAMNHSNSYQSSLNHYAKNLKSFKNSHISRPSKLISDMNSTNQEGA